MGPQKYSGSKKKKNAIEKFIHTRIPIGMEYSKTFSQKVIHFLKVEFKRILKLGCSPDYIIAGYPKAGTTTLYEYLLKHPNFSGSSTKEIYFFNTHFSRGKNWYCANFPTIKGKKIIGESTVEYAANPFVPQRVKDMYPDMKIIIMLRNPIERAYSHYNMHNNYGITKETFDEVIKKELSAYKNNKISEINPFLRYMTGYDYLEGIQRWEKLFGKKQILVIICEEFFSNPAPTFKKTFNFLGAKPMIFENVEKVNAGNYYRKMSPETRKILEDFFKPRNAKLAKHLGQKLPWK